MGQESEQRAVDIVIVGGGPAGLSTALVLGRSLRQVVVVDEGKPRNRSAQRSHGYLTRDGIEPETMRALAREELRRYETVEYRHGVVTDVTIDGGRFCTMTREGAQLTSPVIVFATGMKERLPEWNGLSDVYGTSVFPCPYCDGWELRSQPLAVLGGGPSLLQHIRLIHNWSRDLVVCTDGPAALAVDERSLLQARGIALYEQPIAALESRNGQLAHIVLDDGQRIARRGAFLTDTGAHQATDIPRKLGVTVDEAGRYKTKAHGLTRVSGLYIIGDAKHSFTGIAGAASEGYEAAVAINQALTEQDWQ